jgi:histidyl-tRNA synthetase
MHDAGIKAVGAIGKSSMKEQIAMAESFKVPYMVLMGLTEVREGKAIIREMSKGTQSSVMLEDLVSELEKLIGKDNLDNYNPIKGLIKKQ